MLPNIDSLRLSPKQLRWRCDPGRLPFDTTADVEPSKGTLGQESALDALRFGLECSARGQNVYVRGMTGSGRMTMVRRMLDDVCAADKEQRDYCYVHNFRRPDRPRLITLKAGQSRDFRRRVQWMAEYIAEQLPAALDNDALQSQRSALQTRMQEEIKKITAPLEEDLKAAGFALVNVQGGQGTQTAIFPVVDGKPLPPMEFFQLASQGKVSPERREAVEKNLPEFQNRLQKLGREVGEAYQKSAEEVRGINEKETRRLLEVYRDGITAVHDHDSVSVFLAELVQDVVDNRLSGQPAPDPRTVYDVNIVVERDMGGRCPVIFETTPSLTNLLGAVEPEWQADGNFAMNFRGVRAGSLLRADGGYLVVDIHDLMAEPGTWRALTRTLRTGTLEIIPSQSGFMRPAPVLKPEPAEVDVRVIVVGDAASYYQLDRLDPDFSHLFKVLVDVDHEMPRNDDSLDQYARIITNIIREENLQPFTRDAVAETIEHGARIASRRDKLTAQFGRIADIVREASFLAPGNGDQGAAVRGQHVREAVIRTKSRASLPSRKFQQMLRNGTLIVETEGGVVGQVNGLAVMQSGPLTYGFPARITATIGPGRAGLINIEGQASMSGTIHTKGFHILGGLLRHLLRSEHPLAFSASIAFEQSYGGIDGDSASGAEMCCLLSALTDVPLGQNLAMTGAIDQHGRIQAIGGVNEKIEGFFDCCHDAGLNGEQGVIIPTANAGDLMLRQDVVDACENGQFSVFAVSRIEEALAIFTGRDSGSADSDGNYPEDSILGLAQRRAREYWQKTLTSPQQEADPT